MKVIAYVPDLMDRSRFIELRNEADVSFVRDLEDLGGEVAEVAVADLGRDGAIDALAQSAATRRVGYLSHIDKTGRARAQELKIEVYARSKFFSRLVAVVTQGGQNTADTDD